MEILSELVKRFRTGIDYNTREKYSYDWGALSPQILKHRKLPDAVVWLDNKEQVKEFIELQSDYHFRIVERGRGTNTLGGAMPVKDESIVVLPTMSDFKIEGGVLSASPGTEFSQLDLSLIPVYPTSYATATIGGYVGGGSLGIGSLKYGAMWDNITKVEVITPKGDFLLEGEDVKKVAQSAGTVGIITRIWMKLVKKEEVKIKEFKVSTLKEAIDVALNNVDEAEMITIRNNKMASEISSLKGEDTNWGKWNVFIGSRDEGKEISSKDIVTTFAGSYFTLVNREKTSYMSIDLDVYSLESLEGSDYMVECDFARSSGRLFSHTYILGYTEEPKIDGKTFNLHSFRINDRVEEDRL
ncbi:FAD-binding protein [Acidianus sp. RZ1]|uniref:FAD-binding oxidoreductase n=1 Tax=Acidianus sp. RZ1 TaxID=1540082 RepID=UPI001492C626|nr:FAD-binding oxidoreductase [Acidianus sp. RZ1]